MDIANTFAYVSPPCPLFPNNFTSDDCPLSMPHSQHDGETTAAGIPVTLVTDNLEKPSLDDRDYRVTRLSNDLEMALVHDPKTNYAGGVVAVGVGSFSDDSAIPGIVHAIEHSIPMGTEKYPAENDYKDYIINNGGDCKAMTWSTWTTFSFHVSAAPGNDQHPSDINPSPLRGALDRLAQFFIAPLFLPETLDGALKTVDSENCGYLEDDLHRLNQLERSLNNPDHPSSNFTVGSLKTLKTIPEKRGINIRDKFIHFCDNYHSANRMTLVIVGKEPVDLLEKWATESFSPILNRNLARCSWPEHSLFRDSDLGMQCFAKPIKELREIRLYFPFVDEESMPGAQPGEYLSHLIQREDSGSILSYIKAKGWAKKLTAAAVPTCPGTPARFTVVIRLEPEGLENYSKIIKVFFQYVSILKETPPQEWIFQELKRVADIDFEWSEKTPPISLIHQISSAMRTPMPREWLLKGPHHPREFDPDQIVKALATIHPDNFQMLVVSQTYPGKWDEKEKWYGTEYHREKIPDPLMEELRKAATASPKDRISALHLPNKNKFIPDKLEVEKKEVQEPALCPTLLRVDNIARTWWKKDDRFWRPRAVVKVRLRSPLVWASAENMAMTLIFSSLVNEALKEPLYQTELAGLQYNVEIDVHGLVIEVSGYNSKVPMLLELVVAKVRGLDINGDSFNSLRRGNIRAHKNWLLQLPACQTDDYANWLNTPERYFTMEERISGLTNVTLEGIRHFQNQLLGQLFIDVYVLGNIDKKEALDLTDMVVSTLDSRAFSKLQWPIPRSLILPEGSNYVFKKTLENKNNVNNCVDTWFYVGSRENRECRTKLLLLEQMLRQPVINQLRTEENLGYQVASGHKDFSMTSAFCFRIQGQMTTDFLDSRIEAFLKKYADTLGDMSQHDAERIRLLTKSTMVEFFDQYFSPASSQRARLSIHLQAQSKAEGIDQRQKEAQKKADEGPSAGDAVKNAEEITDVRKYKAGLTASPGARPVKDISELEEVYA
ncbi:hypothetical protein FSARC_11712 [Fusarium sarcochroum]|uniref:Insulysin n=1 Tax=Fusarium sarcochroum TaxID=1208366 RepID=A0A8H4TDF6_9HYPO|nr:hypothetical protein FSARC_11712 [Fusarium sarcochroum]